MTTKAARKTVPSRFFFRFRRSILLLAPLLLSGAVSAAGPFTREIELTASDGAAGDSFGDSVAISGDTAVIGAQVHSHGGTQTGAAYVFVRSGGTWIQRQELTPSDPSGAELFGSSVALSGDMAVVGARNDSNGEGSVYVFVRSGGVWSQQQKLRAKDASGGRLFGFAVALSGDTVVVGSPSDRQHGDLGAAYVFIRSGGLWTQQQKLTASEGAEQLGFGWSVAVTGDTAMIGAPYDSEAAYEAGAAYVFVRSGEVWSRQQKLTASDAAARDGLGFSVSMDQDAAAVGAPLANSAAGAAYVFRRSSGGPWAQQQKLTASDAAHLSAFAASASVKGDLAAFGAPYADSEAGAAYVFARSNGGPWAQQQELAASDGAARDFFGTVAVESNTVLVGSAYHSTFNGYQSGAAYVYEAVYLTALAPAKIWLGLKSSADIGTNFDLKAEVLLNGATIGSGEVDGVPGGGTGFNGAVLRTIGLALSSGPVLLQPGDRLAIRLSVRIAATGHRSGTARLWYNDVQANSGFAATIDGLTIGYYLQDGFRLGRPGFGPTKTIDVLVDRLAGGNPWKPFGTWSTTF